jgi:MYXO-CTERM domain-containing protein
LALIAAVSSLLVGAIAGCGSPDDIDSTTSAINISKFTLPSLSAAARAKIVHKHNNLDPKNVIPRGLLEDAMLYFDVNAAQIPKKTYFVVVDLSRYSGKDRFWLVNLSSGAVEAHKVAHGNGSDPDNNGYATLFGNKSGSNMSSLGFGLTAEIFDGTHPHSMRLDGLSVDGSPNGMANTKMRSRGIIVHEASYVDDSNSGQQGRSEGCLALDSAIAHTVADRTHDGSLLYVAKSALNTPVGRSKCGDKMCDGGETYSSCPADCPGPTSPPVDAGSNPPSPDAGGGEPGIDARGSEASVQAGGDAIDRREDDPSLSGGCSVGHGGDGGAGFLIALALLGRRRRRRR